MIHLYLTIIHARPLTLPSRPPKKKSNHNAVTEKLKTSNGHPVISKDNGVRVQWAVVVKSRFFFLKIKKKKKWGRIKTIKQKKLFSMEKRRNGLMPITNTMSLPKCLRVVSAQKIKKQTNCLNWNLKKLLINLSSIVERLKEKEYIT